MVVIDCSAELPGPVGLELALYAEGDQKAY